MGERVIIQKLAVMIGHDEFVRLFAVRDREGVALVVFDQPDDFEFILLTIGRLDNEDVAKFDFTFAYRFAVVSVDDGLLLLITIRRRRWSPRFGPAAAAEREPGTAPRREPMPRHRPRRRSARA